MERACVRSLGPSFQAASAIEMLWSWKNNFPSQFMHVCLCVLVVQPCLTLCVPMDSQAPLSMGFPPVKKSLWQTRCEIANSIHLVYELWLIMGLCWKQFWYNIKTFKKKCHVFSSKQGLGAAYESCFVRSVFSEYLDPKKGIHCSFLYLNFISVSPIQ